MPSRFCTQNEGVFANADTAYVLAYSLIMLNTDAHSAQIKKKMTQQEFVNMNRGINDSGDLPTPFLEACYQAIVTNEIKIKEHELVPQKESGGSAARPNKTKLFHMESAMMVKRSQELFKAKARKKSVYHSSRSVQHVQPMFEASWCAVLAACSSVMEAPEEETPEAVVALTLRGFANAVHIAAEFGMTVERDAFVTMLAKYTYLESTKPMARRNIESFKTLVHVALSDGNGLGSSWAQVLKCLSEFQRLHMIGTGAKTDAQLFFPTSSTKGAPPPAAAPPAAAPSDGSTKLVASSSSTRAAMIIQQVRPKGGAAAERMPELLEVDALNSQTMVDKVDVVAIDRIFSLSAQLNPDAIVEFVRHLCSVAHEELGAADPQVYALQKLVEIAYYNMSRVRLVWARIWKVLGEFFTDVGQHPNLSIAMYAVDSLRQLSMKFLEKGELLNYQFQREFLKPFQDLMAVAAARETKDFILGCLGHMIQSRAKSIRSGWRSMFAVYALAAADPAVAATGLEIVMQTIADHFELIAQCACVGECVECVCEYVRQQRHAEIALRAVGSLATCAELLRGVDTAAASSSSAAAAAAADPDGDGAASSTAAGLAGPERLWWPLLGCLATAVRDDGRAKVRAAALEGLFVIVNAELASGGVLGGELGVRAFQELVLPILAFKFGDPPSASQLEWVRTTGAAALPAVERAFSGAYELLAPLLDELIGAVVRSLQQPHDAALAHVAAECLLHLVKATGASFSQETWTEVCARLTSCFVQSGAPAAEPPAPEAGGADVPPTPLLREVSAKVEAEAPPGSGPHEMQVLLLSTVYQLLQSMYPSMKLADVEGLLNCLHGMYDKAHKVVQSALSDDGPSPPRAELEEALHLQLESTSFYLQVIVFYRAAPPAAPAPAPPAPISHRPPPLPPQVLFGLFAKLEPGKAPPPKDAVPALGSDDHVLHVAAASEFRLVSFCLHVLRNALKLQELSGADGGNALATEVLAELTPNVVMLLQGILAFHEPQFVKHLPGFYPLFVELMHAEAKPVRQTLRDIFSQRIGTVLQQGA